MLYKKRLFAFHTDLSRIFQPKIFCAVFSFPAFSRPAFLCHIFQSRIFQPCSFAPHFPFLHFPALHFSLCRIFISRIFSRPDSNTGGGEFSLKPLTFGHFLYKNVQKSFQLQLRGANPHRGLCLWTPLQTPV